MVNLILIHDAAVSRTNNLLSIVKVCHLNSNSNQGFAYLVRHFLITCTKFIKIAFHGVSFSHKHAY